MGKLNCIVPLTKVIRILVKEGLVSENTAGNLPLLRVLSHLILAILISTLMISSIIGSIKSGDIIALNNLVCVLISAVTVFSKVFTLVRNRNCFMSVLNDLKSKTFNDHTNQQNEHIQLVNTLAQITLRFYTTVAVVFLMVACLLPLVMNVKLLLPPPFEVEKLEFLYKLLQFVIVAYLALNSVSCDVLFMSVMGLCGAQLNILEERLIHIPNEAQERAYIDNLTGTTTQVERMLKECIILHEMLNKFTNKLSTILSFPLFIQYSCGCFIICNTILQLTITEEAETSDLISLIAFSCATFSQLVLYHWLGNEIIFKSDKIIESCYLSEWYNLNNWSRKFLLLIMERAKRPLAIEVYKLIYISFASLGVIIRWSYSIFALIKARYN